MDERIIRAKLEGIRGRSEVGSWPIGGWEARTAEHRGADDYRLHGGWAAVDTEGSWEPGLTLFLRASARPPAPPRGCTLHLAFDLQHLEGLLSLDGRPYQGIDHQHPRAALLPPLPRDLALELELDCVPAARFDASLRRERARVRETRFVAVDDETEALWHDVGFAWEASRVVRDARRRTLLESAVEAALLAVELGTAEDAWRGSVREARALLADRLAAIAPDPEAGSVLLTGHSHIDTAWLWPLRETVRKCGRTFATALRLMERFPSYHFSCSQPQLYAYAKRSYPALWQQIRRRIEEGRWEPTGGMWVESDCNVPSGESLARQFLHGIAFFRREFGRRPRTCWLPDVFGYPASLPGILAGCGIPYFYTNKLHWQARNPFPAHLFHWEGIDGSRVLGHVPRLPDYYNGNPVPSQLAAAWEGFSEKAAYPELLFPFGFGDGGGGPTETMLAFADRARSFPGLPRCRQGREEEYFDAVAAAAPELPAWVGELYLETHRGTFTSQAAIKRANRRGELLLREAEIASSLAGIEGFGPPGAVAERRARLAAAWENLLLLQFHDILPGSSIGEVYREALADQERIASEARSVREAAVSDLLLGGARDARDAGRAVGGSPLLAFNSLAWERRDAVEALIPDPGDGPLEVVSPDGATTPAQVVRRSGGEACIVFAGLPLPSVGLAGLVARRASTQTGEERALLKASADGRRLESRSYLLELAADGTISRLFDKRHDREVVPPGAAANDLQLFQDGPEHEAAWNIHATYAKRRYSWDTAAVELLERGPVRAVVRVRRSRGATVIEQDITLWAALERIDFVTRADWQERQTLLKAAFPVEVRSDRATFEIAWGAVDRPTHRNTSWDQEKFEVCGHRWADLSEGGYGVSLLNDGSYGWDALGSVLRLSLLRGPQWPDPDADRGPHRFTYSLLPHAGSWREAGTAHRAWELNVPTVCRPMPSGGGADLPRSLLSVSGPGASHPAVLEALKPAEDGDGWVLRISEPQGGRGRVNVRLPLPLARVEECNHVEEGGEPVPSDGSSFSFPLKPFQVRSFRLRFA